MIYTCILLVNIAISILACTIIYLTHKSSKELRQVYSKTAELKERLEKLEGQNRTNAD